MKSTKQKIIDAALKLFNKSGLINTRLQHISDKAFISIGNMAYHYPNKEAIVMTLYKDLEKKQRDLLAEYRVVPLFDNMDRLFRKTFLLQAKYVFYYLDALEITRAYPEIAVVHRQHIEWQINQLKSMLDFNVSRGAMVPEPLENIYKKLSVQIWMTVDMWPVQQVVRGELAGEEQVYREAVWALLFPYFTKVGRQEYEQMLEGPYDLYF